MNATSDSLAVVEARLPYTDRGSFSQAWFSALHLAGDARGSTALARSHRPLDAGARIASDAKCALSSRAAATHARNVSPSTAGNNGRFGSGVLDDPRESARRTTVRLDAASSARSLRAATTMLENELDGAPFRATLSIDGGNARVHLLMRREGDTIHVIALCSEKNTGLVRRALACAERELAAAGRRIATGVRTFEGSAT